MRSALDDQETRTRSSRGDGFAISNHLCKLLRLGRIAGYGDGSGSQTTHRTPWRTVFRALATVAVMAAVKPKRLKLGSKPDATTTPSTTGMSAAYTEGASRLPMMMAAIAAVKKGVVEPIACAQRKSSWSQACRPVRLQGSGRVGNEGDDVWASIGHFSQCC